MLIFPRYAFLELLKQLKIEGLPAKLALVQKPRKKNDVMLLVFRQFKAV